MSRAEIATLLVLAEALACELRALRVAWGEVGIPAYDEPVSVAVLLLAAEREERTVSLPGRV